MNVSKPNQPMRAEEILRKSVFFLQQQAEAYLNQGQFEDARKASEQLLKIQPKHAPGYKIIGDVLLRQGQPEEAQRYYTQALQLQPDWAEVHANLGSIHAKAQQWQQALDCYQKAIAIKPDFAGAYRNLARVWTQLNQPQKVNQCWYKAYTLEPQQVTAAEHLQLGKALLQQGNIEEAIACYRNAIQRDPNLSSAYQSLADALKQQGKMQEATPYYRKAIELNAQQNIQQNITVFNTSADTLAPAQKPQDISPQDTLAAAVSSASTQNGTASAKPQPQPPKPEELITKATAFCAIKKWEAAINTCQEALKIKPDLAVAYKIQGNALQMLGEISASIRSYEKALAIQPHYPEVNGNLGSLYAQQERLEKAVYYYQQAITQKPDFAGAYRNVAKIFTEMGDHKKASHCLEKAYELEPEKATAEDHLKLGNTRLKQGQLQAAMTCYRHALRLNPQLAVAYHGIGEIQRLQGDAVNALQSYRKATELAPKQPEFYHSLGQLLAQQEQTQEALEIYKKLLELNPNNALAYHQVGDIFKQQWQLKEATAAYRKAIQLNPNSAPSYYSLGKVLAKQEQWQEAASVLRQAMQLDGNADAEAYKSLADALVQAGETEEAINCYQKATELDSNSAEAYQKLANLLRDKEQFEEAIQAYHRAIELKSDVWWVHNGLADILYKLERWEDAIEYYRKSIELNPEFSWSHNSLADALVKLERWEEAVIPYRKAIELNPEFPWTHYNLGEVLVKLENWEEAVVAYRKAQKLQSDLPAIEEKLADALRERAMIDLNEALGYYRQVIQQNPDHVAIYHKALEIQPDDAQLYSQLADTLVRFNQLDGAIVFYQMAQQLEPEDANITYQLEEVMKKKNLINPPFSSETQFLTAVTSQKTEELELLDDAIFKYRQEVENNPNNCEFYKKLGQLLHKKGSINEAIEVYSTAVKLSPESADFHHHLGAAFAVVQRWDEAIVEYRKAIDFHDKSPFIYNHLGEAQAKLRLWSEAIASYQKAIELDPDYANYHYNLAEALEQTGKLKQAIRSYQKAVELNPKFTKAVKRLAETQMKQAAADAAYLHRKNELGTPETDYEGCLDAVSSEFVYGWARHKFDPNKVVFVDVFVGNNLIGIYPANKFRQDLADAFQTHGCHKFELKIPPSLNSDGLVEVSVRISETGQHLKKSPIKVLVGTDGKKHQSSQKSKVSVANQLVYRPPLNLPASRKPVVGIIILNLNGAKLLQNLFESLLLYNSYRDIELIIVDHGSKDESVSLCQQWSEQLPIKVIARGDNYSFSESNNLGVNQTTAPLLLFMNNDITLCQDIIPGLVDLMRDETIGIVGVKLLDIVSERSLAQPPTQHLGVQFNFYTQFEPFYPFEVRYAPQMLSFQSVPWRVPVVTGALMICRRQDFLEAQGFCEDYFYGYEDVDLCLYFGQKLGREIICANHLTAFHHRGFSRFSGKPSESFQKRLINNKDLLEQRFGYYVRRRHLQDFFEKGMYWTSHPLRIGFIVTDADLDAAAGDYFTAVELGEQFVQEYGWEVFYLSEGPQWYNLHQLDVIVVMRHEYDLRLIENAKPTLVKVAWARNWFEVWASSESAQHYDCFWCSSQKAADYVSQKLSKPVTLVRIATNLERFYQQAEFDPNLKSDYCFTGSFWNSPREIINYLNPENLPFEFALYGHNWEQFSKFEQSNRGAISYTKLPQVYASTKIVIDDANAVTKEWGSTNSRVFDAIAAGALVVTNGKLGNQEAFDGLLPTYDSAESLEQVLWTYLTDESLRRQRVEQLQQILKEKHTYNHRAQTVFTSLREKMTLKYRIGIKIGVPEWKQANEWGDYHFAKALKRAFERQGHSVRIDILSEWENPQSYGDDIALVIRGLSQYQPKSYQINLMWNISHPDKVSLEEYEQYDHVFVASYSYAEELQQKVKVPVQTLLQCTDPELFYPDETGDEEVGEILFVGNSRKVYRKIVKDAVETGLKVDVYGTNWEPLLPPGYLKGEYIPNEILRRYYTRCGVLLNDHWDTMREKGFISNRLFDAGACGAMIITDEVPGLDAVFGDKITVYREAKNLPIKVKECLQQKGENVGKRLELVRLIGENHSFEKRSGEIVTVIERLNEVNMSARARD